MGNNSIIGIGQTEFLPDNTGNLTNLMENTSMNSEALSLPGDQIDGIIDSQGVFNLMSSKLDLQSLFGGFVTPLRPNTGPAFAPTDPKMAAGGDVFCPPQASMGQK